MYFPKHHVPCIALGKVATIDTPLVPPADRQLFSRDLAPGFCVPLINDIWIVHVSPITDGGLAPNVSSTIAESDFRGESLVSFRTFLSPKDALKDDRTLLYLGVALIKDA